MTLYTPPRMGVRGLSQFNPSPTGCVLYAPLWSPYLSGATFKSQDLYGRTCTVTGATWGSQGRTFAGGGDKIALPASVYQAFSSADDFSIVMWFNHTTNANYSAPLAFTVSGVWQPLIMIEHTAADEITCTVRQTANATNNVVTSSGAPLGWLHVGMTHDASDTNRVTQYLNGALEGSINTNALTFAKTDFSQGLIGALASSVNVFYNTIGEVLIWNRVLSAGEITQHCNQTKWRYQ